MIMFNELVQNTRFLRRLEYAREINHSGSDIRDFAVGAHIFDVQERETVGISTEILKSVLPGSGDPVQIEFHFHQSRIGLGKNEVVGQLSFFNFELKIMIVIGELNSPLPALLTCTIKDIRDPLPVR